MTTTVKSILDVFREQRSLLLAGALVVGMFTVGAIWDAHRAATAEGEIHILEEQTADAQRARHLASVQAIVARAALQSARAHADSLEASAAAAEAKSVKLGQLVRVMSETSLVVQLTPGGPANAVSVPRVVTAYIESLTATIAEKDSALAARDTQVVRADTVIVTVNHQVAADSTVITTQHETVQAEKSARPRFGFKSGVIAGVVATIAIIKTAAALLK